MAFPRAAVVALAALVLAIAPFAAGLCGYYPTWFRAAAQNVTEVSICGGCSCFSGAEEAACEERQRLEYERANPPRGAMEGVCYASYSKWERDASGREKLVEQSPIYSRFRYTETKVDGYNEVGNAWYQFIAQNQMTAQPDRDGWRWRHQCAVLSGGSERNRNDARYWTEAQGRAQYERVFMPTFGVADTPEERALEAKLAREREAKAAEAKRIADAKAAEAARIKAAAEAKRRAEVAAMEAQLGPGKRASAERLLAMNAEVAKYRPKQPLAVTPKPAATPSPSPSSPPRQCTRRQGTQTVSHTAATREAAEAGIARARGTPGGSETIVQSSVGAATCTQQNQLYIKPPPVGTCLACISEAMAAQFGWVKGKGYPPPKTEWVCKAVVTFTAEKCGSGTSKVSNQ